MAYTEEQKLRFQTFPANIVYYTTVSFSNPLTDELHILASGENGPYTNKTFNINGVPTEFIPVSCDVPQATDQADDNKLGTITFGRVGLEVFQYIDEINSAAVIPSDTIITVTIRQWQSGIEEPIFERACYSNNSGIVFDNDNVNIELATDNNALVGVVAAYLPSDYPGMAYSDQGEDEGGN